MDLLSISGSPRSHRLSGLGVAFVGMMLIASTYGMARFSVGLFAPRLVVERPALASVVGLAAAAQFVSYAMAAAAAARLSDYWPRTALVLAGVTATVGCVGVAVASEPVSFVAAVFVGGMGAGFASPAMVRVIDAVVSDGLAPTAQSMVNSGTAAGVIGAGVLGFVTTSTARPGFSWRWRAPRPPARSSCWCIGVLVWRCRRGQAPRPRTRLPPNGGASWWCRGLPRSWSGPALR